MARMEDVMPIQDELIDAYKWGEKARARALILQLGDTPDSIRARLEAMLEDSYGLARQAAAFALGELGGAASVRRLEQQLLLEEARGGYDGEAVVESIVEALGRVDEPSARNGLVRRLERLVGTHPERSDLYVLAQALWRRRHPDLLPVIQRILERSAFPEPTGLRGLWVLLEKSPEELGEWARDLSVSVENKTEVLVVLGEELPDGWVSLVLGLITTAQAVSAQAVNQNGEAAHYCERLFSVLLMHRERVLSALSEEARAGLREVARSLVASSSMGCSSWAASMLGFVGRLEDVAVLEAHHPADPVFAKAFDEAARALRSLQSGPY